jgi:hypothetical protein
MHWGLLDECRIKENTKIISNSYQERTQCTNSLLPANYNIITVAVAAYNA